jgi:hypothetical protein
MDKQQLKIGDILARRIKCIGENEQTYTGCPDDLIKEISDNQEAHDTQIREDLLREILNIEILKSSNYFQFNDNYLKLMDDIKQVASKYGIK